MKNLSFILFMILATNGLQAQNYKTALGVKGDWSTTDMALAEISLKHFFQGSNAFEINLGGSSRYIWLQLMYERNQSITSQLDWYWGAGIDGGRWTKGNYGRSSISSTSGFWAGIDGLIGLEYTFNYIPINIALDTGPTIRMVPDVQFGWMAGFALRYGFR